MKISKGTEASKPTNDDVDLFDKLPEPILHLIVSRLTTTEDAFRASVLSTRWRYLWTFVPSLDIDCNRGLKPFINLDKNKFKEFVDCVLVNKTLDLESVRLSCGNHYNMSTVREWIQAAVIRKVKSLYLSFCPKVEDEVVELPRCLIECDSLEVLRLNLHNFALYLRGVNGFPALRVLELNNVELLGDDMVNLFFNSCPLLADLSLIDCFSQDLWNLCISSPTLKTLRIDDRKLEVAKMTDDGGYHGFLKLQISCPKLVVLEYAGFNTYELSFENLESLKKAVVHPEPVGRQDIPLFTILLSETICKLFAGVSHVKSLSLNLYFIQAIGAACDSDKDLQASFPNLKKLEISTTVDDYTMKAVVWILRCTPKLESLYLTIEKENISPDLCELDEVVARHLKKVEFLEFNGEKQKLDMARFLLKHGHELEEMVFSWRDKVSYHEKSMDTLKEVSKFLDSKASSTVKLSTLLKE